MEVLGNTRLETKGANEETDNDHYSFAFEEEELVTIFSLILQIPEIIEADDNSPPDGKHLKLE